MLRNLHTRLLVDDFPATFRFYRDILGLSVAFGNENDVYADFSVGDTTLALFRRDLMALSPGPSPAGERSGDTAVLCFAVEDVDATCEQFLTRGLSPVAAPQDRPDWMIRTAHFRDPEGNLVEINSAMPQEET